MQTASAVSPLRLRLIVYLASLGALAMMWGYLLFIRPRRQTALSADTSHAETRRPAPPADTEASQ
jgi:hypothetical protein